MSETTQLDRPEAVAGRLRRLAEVERDLAARLYDARPDVDVADLIDEDPDEAPDATRLPYNKRSFHPRMWRRIKMRAWELACRMSIGRDDAFEECLARAYEAVLRRVRVDEVRLVSARARGLARAALKGGAS